MKMIAACAALSLPSTACATPVPTPGDPLAGNGDDCAVIAAVLREHHQFDDTPRREPVVSLGDSQNLRCEWARYGIAPPVLFDADTLPYAPRSSVSVGRPIHDSGGAQVQTRRFQAPDMHSSWRCRVRSGFAGWTVERCDAVAAD